MTKTFQVVDGDWVRNVVTGQPAYVSDRTKLVQDVSETLAVETQPNGFGAGLDGLLGRDVDPFGFEIQVQQQVRAAILTLQRLQSQYLSSRRSATERIAALTLLVVSPTEVGGGDLKTSYSFQLRVRPVAGAQVTRTGALVP